EIRIAFPNFASGRFVAGRQKLDGVPDPAIGQHQWISARRRLRRRSKPVAVQRFVTKDARMLAGERAAARVRAVHARRESDDDKPRCRIAERWHRLAPVRRVIGGHGVEKLRKPRAASTRGVVWGGGAYFWHHQRLAGRVGIRKSCFAVRAAYFPMERS